MAEPVLAPSLYEGGNPYRLQPSIYPSATPQNNDQQNNSSSSNFNLPSGRTNGNSLFNIQSFSVTACPFSEGME